MKARRRRANREPTIALINVVFLMLIFFLIAGTVAAPIDPTLTLIKTDALKGTSPPDGLIIHADGRLEAGGVPVADAAAYLAGLTADDRSLIRVIPDRDLPAAILLQIGAALREAGAEQVMIATERTAE